MIDRRDFLRRFSKLVGLGFVPGEILRNGLDIYERIAENRPGLWPTRQDITVLPPDDPRKLRLGWKIYEEVGAAFVNDYDITRIDVRGERCEWEPTEPEIERPATTTRPLEELFEKEQESGVLFFMKEYR